MGDTLRLLSAANNVPAPGTLILLGIGVAGSLLAKRPRAVRR